MKNNYFKIPLIGIVLLSGCMLIGVKSVKAQDVLSITEKNQDNKTFNNPKVVDINSTLLISVDKVAIIKKLGTGGQYNLPKATGDLLDLLNQALKKQDELLTDFKATIASYNPGDATSVQQFNKKLQTFGIFASTLFRTDPTLKNDYNVLMTASGGKKIADNVFVALQKRITDMEADLAQLNATNANTIQLGAWLNNGGTELPLHLKGFDQLADQPYYTVDRWQYLPTADQLAQFKQLQEYAQKNRDNGLDVLKSSVTPYIDAFKSYVQKLVSDSLTDVTKAFDLIKNDYTATPIGADIVKLKTTVQALMDLVKNDITFYSNLEQSGNISAASLVIQIGGDVNAINDNINQIKQEITDINNSINTLSATLIQKAKTLSNLLKTKADSLFTAFDTRVLSAVSAGYQTDVAALEYSDKVLKLSLTDLPLSTQLDLNYTGARKAGDMIELKISINSNNKTIDLDSYTVPMYRLALHLEGTVGLLFAHPIVHTNMQGAFQMAPYFNLLFKDAWPWTENYHRRSVINNTLMDFSFGLSVSSPDFNKDDVPELGVGVVLSGFKDIVQIGFAHDVFLNKPFVFFGIRLPIPATNFGSNGQTNSSVQ